MCKVILLLALVASLSIVYCDDPSNNDCQDAGLRIIQNSEQSESPSSSSSSSHSTSSSSSSLASGKSARSLSSSSSISLSSDSETSSSKKSSKIHKINDSDDVSNAPSNDAGGSGSADVDETAQASTETNGSGAQPNSDSGADSALSYKCGANEVFSNCTNGGCDARNCSQAGKSVPCVKLNPRSCIKGCVCQPDYLRASNGTCVPRYQCNEGCGDDPNAHPGCGVNCGKTCASYKTKNPICPLFCNLNGCDCNEGYVLDPAVNKCVLPEDCTPKCGVNEIASTCANGGCGPFTCPDVGNPVKCVRPIKCNKGCVCQNYFVRNDNGTCVPQGDCPAKPCGKNQYWEKCIIGCSTQSCDELGRGARSCPAEIVGQCPSGCRCKPNYYRNANNECIPKAQCPVGCNGDPNAQPGCGVNCGKTCSTYKIKHPFCPAVCAANGCDCKDGFVFDANLNKCVLPKDCTPICGLNERFDSCAGFGCGRQNCSQLGQPQICIDPAPGGCKNGCTCVDGYLRADNGTCVPQDQCPGANGCNGDPNAQPGCGINCGRTCSTYKLKNVACPDICLVNGCDCKEGYVYDNNVKRCVLPVQCSVDASNNDASGSGSADVDATTQASTDTNGSGAQANSDSSGDSDALSNGASGSGSADVDTTTQASTDTNGSGAQDSGANSGAPSNDASGSGSTDVDATTPASTGTNASGIQGNSDSGADSAVGCNGDPNAQPGCGVNCGKTCSTYKIKNPVCPAVCAANGCDCKDGFVFDANLNKCVLPKDCSAPSNDASGSGSTDVDATTPASTGTNASGIQGNSDSGADSAVECNGDPNAQPGCGVNCGKTCSTYKIKNPVCPAVCAANGCDCKDGFVFDANLNKCVLPKDCSAPSNDANGSGSTDVDATTQASTGTNASGIQGNSDSGADSAVECNGDPNAQPGCGVNCGKTCSTYKIKNPVCPAVCAANGCDCKDGFVFDDNLNKCVLPKDCSAPSNDANGSGSTDVDATTPASTGTNASGIQGNSDSGADSAVGCNGDPNAQPGCGVNCGKTCSTYKIKHPFCPAVCAANGCDCKNGFVFDANLNKCVLPKDCSAPSNDANGSGSTDVDATTQASTGTNASGIQGNSDSGADSAVGCNGDPNAQPGCGVNCGKTCSTYKIKNPVCPAVCAANGCDCKDGFVFDANLNKCVLPKDCSAPSNDANGSGSADATTQASTDTNASGTQGNSNSGANSGASSNDASGSGSSDVDATTQASTDTNGSGAQANSVSGANGDAPNNDAGGWGSADVNATTQASTDTNGYGSQANSNSSADSARPCGKNQHWVNCITDCRSDSCDIVGGGLSSCPGEITGTCPSGCRCIKGYYRNSDNECIPRAQCQICNHDTNAKPGCGVNCGKTCAYLQGKNPPCPRICDPDGCDCKDGFFYDANLKKCVLPKDCTIACGLNERYDTCTNGGCGHKNCSQLGQPQVCIDVIESSCVKGCSCVAGYLRAENGTCIPQNQCPGAGCGGDPNAHKGCGINCGNTCSTYKVKNKSLICPRIPCRPIGCDCNTGYVFDANQKKCVLPQECTPICKQNEKYNACVNGGCDRRNCSQLSQPQICIDVIASSCVKGCVCADGYLRADNGTCIPQNQCPVTGCGGDRNAQQGCGYNCGKKCSTYKIKNKSLLCPRIECKPDKCDCKDGFVFDDNLKKCVRPAECTPICGLNEQYNACINGGCEQRNCSQLGQPQLCVDVIESSCVKGCICASGYLRADNGTCIPQDACPKPTLSDQCPGQNEFFDTCISGCGNQTCDSIGKIINCPLQPAVCRTGCRCKPGFYRNPQNVCVAESDCPAPPCPEGEVYSRCPNVKCEGDYCPKTRNSSLTCPVGIVCDQPRCVCGFNSKRDRKTGKCIRISDCPPFKCDGPNESYQSCPATCPGEKCSDYIYSTKCPPFRIGIVVPCQPQCKCNKGYYRNSDGICISGPECGPKQSSSPVPIVEPITAPPATDAPVTSTDAPVTSTDAPVTSTDAPVTSTDAPATSTDAPVTSTDTPAVTTTASPTTGYNSVSTGDAQAALAKLQAGVTSFNGKFLYDRMKSGGGANIIASPFSVFTPLAQLALYANGECLKQLTTILNVPSKNDIRAAFPLLASSFEGPTSVNFSIAAKVYSNEDYPLSEGFLEDSVHIIHAEAQELNFSMPVQAADTINSWVENKTNDRIKDLIQSSDLSSLTRIVLVNAIYFKGMWLKSFNTKNTQDADFYLSDGTTKKTKLMYQESQFNYGEVPRLDLKVLEMYYTDKNFSMLWVLPNKKDGIMNTSKSLQDPSYFSEVLGSMSNQQVKVYVPPFEINTETDLATILQQEGVTDIFKPKGSGLSGMLKNPQDIYVSKAIQKAFIKVDEQGSEAAAANGVIVTTRSLPLPPADPIVFRADHPFLFYIRAKGTTLFCGSFLQ